MSVKRHFCKKSRSEFFSPNSKFQNPDFRDFALHPQLPALNKPYISSIFGANYGVVHS